MLKINGKPYGFKLNIQAQCEIMDICPNGDISKFDELFKGNSSKIIQNDIRVALILNKAYEDEKKWKDRSYEPLYLTREDIMFGLTAEELPQLEKEITKALMNGRETSVEAEVPKKKGKNVSQAKEQVSD